MEATCSSETSVDFQRTTRRYIPEDRTLRNRLCENLRSYNNVVVDRVLSNVRISRTPVHLHNVSRLRDFCIPIVGHVPSILKELAMKLWQVSVFLIVRGFLWYSAGLFANASVMTWREPRNFMYYFQLTFQSFTISHPKLPIFITFVHMVWRRLIGEESIHATECTRIPFTERESCGIEIISFHASKYCVL
jgi:hypothetical protein